LNRPVQTNLISINLLENTMTEFTVHTEESTPEASNDLIRVIRNKYGFHMFKNAVLIAVAGLALVGAGLNAQAEDAPLSVSVNRLSLESAQRVAQATIAECRKQGYQVSVTVVDRNGIPQVMLRDTLGPPMSVSISKDKAYTSANFTAPSGGLERLKDSPLYYRDGLAMMAGGVLIEGGGQVYGAVGVSGAPGGEIDESCAKAGVVAITEDLEMGDL